MKKKGQHLNLADRERIVLLLTKGKSCRAIGEELGISHTTISREIKRNKNQNTGEYLPIKAHRKARKREKLQREKAPLKNPAVYLYVKQKLREEEWSPEAIAGRLPIDIPGQSICHETIYSFIYNQRKHSKEDLRIHLTHHHSKRRKIKGRKAKKCLIQDRISINERPDHINLRQEFGHWETDLMEGLRADKRAVDFNVERKTRFTKLTLVTSKKAQEKAEAVTSKLTSNVTKSMTADNGPENANHKVWAQQLNCQVYFTNPYHSWEKGTVENTIGRGRRFMPKKTSLNHLTHQKVQQIEDQLNSTPRKCLNFLTPKEALEIELKRLKYP